MRITVTIDAEIDDKDATNKSPLMKILKILGKSDDAQVKWYMENRDRILAEEKAKRASYAREQYQKRQSKKKEEANPVNQVVMPTMPPDNILRFDNV